MNNVIPEEFPEWEEVMNTWGNRMMDAQYAIAGVMSITLLYCAVLLGCECNLAIWYYLCYLKYVAVHIDSFKE